MSYQPPFQLTHTLLALCTDIAELVGLWKAANPESATPQLRRENRIRTVQASLAIEQNTLSLEQVTAVLEGKTVLGPPKEIQEVRNAFAAYDELPNWEPTRIQDLLSAHALLMRGLADDAGRFRQGGVGIYRGDRLVHMAPPAGEVPRLVNQLLKWLRDTDAHPLVASCAFHYELEFIHPFSDGNGRIGRLWQTLILSRWQPMLAYLPVETVIKSRQADYYRLLSEADQAADCTRFVAFLLNGLHDALQEAIVTSTSGHKNETRVETQVKTRVKTPDQLLALLAKEPTLTLAEAAQHLGKATSTIERAAAQLRRQGRLHFEGPRKGGRWQVRR